MNFHVGQLVVCVDAGPMKNLGGYREVTNPVWVENLRTGRIYRITHIVRGSHNPSYIGIGDSQQKAGGVSERFRPLVSDEDDAELIARIKACRRIPTAAPTTPTRVRGESEPTALARTT